MVRNLFSAAILFLLLVRPLAADDLAKTTKRFRPNLTSEVLDPVSITPARESSIRLRITLPQGYHLNDEAPSDVVLREDKTIIASDIVKKTDLRLPFTLPALPDQRDLVLESTLYYCKEQGASVCLIKSFRFELPVTVAAGGLDETPVSITVPAEEIRGKPAA